MNIKSKGGKPIEMDNLLDDSINREVEVTKAGNYTKSKRVIPKLKLNS